MSEMCKHNKSIENPCPECDEEHKGYEVATPSSPTELDKAIYQLEPYRCLVSAIPYSLDRNAALNNILTAAKRTQQLEQDNTTLRARVKELEQENDKEIGEFQNTVRNYLMKQIPGCNPDGAGCDSGDWRDFTMSEIGQAIGHLQDVYNKRYNDLESIAEKMYEALKGAEYAMDRSSVNYTGYLKPVREAIALAQAEGIGKEKKR